jgi:hypothetical protein
VEITVKADAKAKGGFVDMIATGEKLDEPKVARFEVKVLKK